MKANDKDQNNNEFQIKKLEKKIKSLEEILNTRERQTQRIVSKSAILSS